jgi:hypothetical protein
MTYREALDDIMRRSYWDNMMHDKSKRNFRKVISADIRKNDTQGNLLHIFLPPGTAFELSNLLEIISPDGVSLDASLPFLKGDTSISTPEIEDIINAIKQAGGSVEIVEE